MSNKSVRRQGIVITSDIIFAVELCRWIEMMSIFSSRNLEILQQEVDNKVPGL